MTEQKVPTHYKYSVVYYQHDTPGPPPLLPHHSLPPVDPPAPGPHSHYNHTITVRGVTRQGHLEKQALLYIMLSLADQFNTCLHSAPLIPGAFINYLGILIDIKCFVMGIIYRMQ